MASRPLRRPRADNALYGLVDPAGQEIHVALLIELMAACATNMLLVCSWLEVYFPGHGVQRAHNSEQALGQLSVGRVDCVVLDLSTGGIGQNLKLLDTIRSSMARNALSERAVQQRVSGRRRVEI